MKLVDALVRGGGKNCSVCCLTLLVIEIVVVAQTAIAVVCGPWSAVGGRVIGMGV